MFEFDELEQALPPEAYVVHGAGCPEADGVYSDTMVEVHGAPIFRHTTFGDQLLAMERCGERLGWLIGAGRRPLYGVRTEARTCPRSGWRPFKGQKPAPTVEGFPSLVEACLRLGQVWREEAGRLEEQGKFRHAAEVYKHAMGLPSLPQSWAAEFRALCAKAFRQLAESKKRAEDLEEDPLHGLAAEWAINEAEEALKLDDKCFLAGWEGAIAAKHVGWWSKGQALAKRAMEAVPSGPAGRAQRETASALFLLLAEEEQREKARKLREAQQARREPKVEVDPRERRWAGAAAGQLNDALKAEDFRRPHHQLWKLVGPGLSRRDADEIFGEIRLLVWQKWRAVASQLGYRACQQDTSARKRLCSRIAEVASTGAAPEVAALVKEIENRTCLEWPEIAEAVDKSRHDETWAWTSRDDGSWGAWPAQATGATP